MYLQNPSGATRLGLTVSKRAGNSVLRNEIKRHVREYFRMNKCGFTRKWDINVIAGPGVGSLTAGELRESLRGVFSKIEEGSDN